MRVVEIFDSIDGEGIRTGQAVTFIRLAGCNLRCSYCDTEYAISYDNCEFEEMAIPQILERVHFKYVTLTGGEPLIHKGVKDLIFALTDKGIEVNIETNGAVDIGPFRMDNMFFTVDYKLPSSGEENKMLWDNFKNLTKNDVVKFVVGSRDDVNKMREVTKKLTKFYGDNLPHLFAGAVFSDYSPKQLVADILENKELHNVRVQLQIHKYIWDPDKRGV